MYFSMSIAVSIKQRMSQEFFDMVTRGGTSFQSFHPANVVPKSLTKKIESEGVSMWVIVCMYTPSDSNVKKPVLLSRFESEGGGQ